MKTSVLLVLFLNAFSRFASSLFFHIGETERKCFIEHLPELTDVVVHFQFQLYDQQKGDHLPANEERWIIMEVINPQNKVPLSWRFGSEKTFKFTAWSAGKYQMCLQPNAQRPLSAGGLLTVQLDMKVGEQTINYTDIAARYKLTELQLRVHQLTEQVYQIQREQNYQRLREEQFREVHYNTDMWIFWWPVVRSLYIVFFIILMTNSW